jgi:hypothetical protein
MERTGLEEVEDEIAMKCMVPMGVPIGVPIGEAY